MPLPYLLVLLYLIICAIPYSDLPFSILCSCHALSVRVLYYHVSPHHFFIIKSITIVTSHPSHHITSPLLAWLLAVQGPVLLALIESVVGSNGDSSGSSNGSGAGSSSSSSSGIGGGSIVSGSMLSVLCRLLVAYDHDILYHQKDGSENTTASSSTSSSSSSSTSSSSSSSSSSSPSSSSSSTSSQSLLLRYQEATLFRLRANPVKHTQSFVEGKHHTNTQTILSLSLFIRLFVYSTITFVEGKHYTNNTQTIPIHNLIYLSHC